jgi:hypothetical protein
LLYQYKSTNADTYHPSATQARLFTCTNVQILTQKALLAGPPAPPAPPAQQQASEEEYERKKRKRDRELAERARARGAARGDGKEVDPAEALVLCQGELAEAKDRVEELEKHLAEEKHKCKNLQKLKDEAVNVAEHALEKALEVQKAAEGKAAEADGGESEAGKEGPSPELEHRFKHLQNR